MKKIFIIVALMTASMFVGCGQSNPEATMIDTISMDTSSIDTTILDTTFIDDGCDLQK